MNGRDKETPASASRHQRAGELFLNALEQPPSERLHFLTNACADDTAMLEEVVSLLNAHGTADNLLTTPIVEAAPVPARGRRFQNLPHRSSPALRSTKNIESTDC